MFKSKASFLQPHTASPRKLPSFAPSVGYYFDNFSQSHACFTNRFRESIFTLLNKLWYAYSYLYRTITICILLVILIMPTTNSSTSNIGIISPSQNLLTRTQSFTTIMNNITITNISFEFRPHCSPRLEFLDQGLNNVYSEHFTTATSESLFSDNTSRLTFNPNAIDLIRTGFIDKLENNGHADQVVIEILINNMPLYATCGCPKR